MIRGRFPVLTAQQRADIKARVEARRAQRAIKRSYGVPDSFEKLADEYGVHIDTIKMAAKGYAYKRVNPLDELRHMEGRT